MTKPTLEEQIDWANALIGCDSAVAPAVLESLLELQSIRSAELPVAEPSDGWSGDADAYSVEDYDALKAYALKVIEERDRHMGAVKAYIEDAEAMRDRALKAESELAALRGRLMEPDEEMLEAGKNCFLSGGYVRELFKAMCAVALKEGK